MKFLEKLKNKIDSLNDAVLQGVELAEEDVRNKRLEICQSCEHLFKPTGNCMKCGCFVKAKTQLKAAECPIKKW